MKEIHRVSPVYFKGTPLKIENRDNWEVVMQYDEEATGPYLVDLSHKPRFDLQDAQLDHLKVFGMTLPEAYGSSVVENGILASRMNRTQVSVYNLAAGDKAAMPAEKGVTDVTDATACLALIGEQVFSICEKLTALDFMDPGQTPPFLFQGPFSHVPCQIVTLSRQGEDSGIILTCSRGYAGAMVHSILHAGEEFKLGPAGEDRFTQWMNGL